MQQCGASTTNGTACKKPPAPDGDGRCHLHQGRQPLAPSSDGARGGDSSKAAAAPKAGGAGCKHSTSTAAASAPRRTRLDANAAGDSSAKSTTEEEDTLLTALRLFWRRMRGGAAAPPSYPRPREGEGAVRVATWNVKRQTLAAKDPAKLANLAADILRSRADIVVLQEVAATGAVAELCSLLRRLNPTGRGPGWCHEESPTLRGTGERAAFLWRADGKRVRAAPGHVGGPGGHVAAFELVPGSVPDPMGRGMYYALFAGRFTLWEGARERRLQLWSVHASPSQLQADLTDTLPALVLRHLLVGAREGAAAAGPRALVTVCGDFNADCTEPAMQRLVGAPGRLAGGRACCGLAPLLPAGVPTNSALRPAQLDNMLVPGPQRGLWGGAAAVVQPAAEHGVAAYSDHRLVFADVMAPGRG